MNDDQLQEQILAENEDIILAEQFEQQMHNMCSDELRSII